MTATQFENPTRENEVYRAKVTGRHAITLPAKLCRQLGIEVGDSVELEFKDGTAELRTVREPRIYTIGELRGILRPYFKDWDDIQQHIKELRDEWDDFEDPVEPPVDESVAD